jgi:hypothetical protein
VFELPLSEASAFREYVHKQGVHFITSVDDWLESRVAAGLKRKLGKSCTAGAFGFAFIDDQQLTKTFRVRRK